MAVSYRRLIFKLSSKFGWRCWYCGSALTIDSASIDHITPMSCGGTDDYGNLALTCTFCNYAKRNLPIEVFLEWLERVRSNETLFKI